jgi:hypothetical protein
VINGLGNRLDGIEGKLPTPEDLRAAAAEGTCRTTQPGGCSTKAMAKAAEAPTKAAEAAKNSADAANKKLDKALEKLDQAANAANLVLLNRIDTKLGPQVTGGVTGALGRQMARLDKISSLVNDKFNKLWQAFGLDRIISLLTLAASLHNAAMLSRDLGETLIETLEAILRAAQNVLPDFLKTPEGKNFDLDLEEFFGNKIKEFLKATLGTDNFYQLKATWTKANRILSTGSNMLGAMRGMQNAVTDGLEVCGGWIAQGFNGIQREGLVSDRTWPWMDESPKFKNKGLTRFTENLDNLEDAASSIQQLANSVTEFTEESKELVEATTELKKTLDEDTKKKAAEEAKKDKESESPDISDSDTKRG